VLFSCFPSQSEIGTPLSAVVNMCVYMCVFACVCVYVYVDVCACERQRERNSEIARYAVSTISRLLKIIGLSCKKNLQKRRYSAKATCNVKIGSLKL